MAADGKAHTLTHSYTFWQLTKHQNMSSDAYFKNMKALGSFSTVEGFWSIYNYLVRPNELTHQVDYYLFREGVKPFWEDPQNNKGGKWLVRLKKGMASRCWEDLCLALIGDTFGLGEEICGVACSCKLNDDIVSVWTHSFSDENSRTKVREMVKQVLDIPSNTALDFRFHDQGIRQAHRRPGQAPGSSPIASRKGVADKAVPKYTQPPVPPQID